MRRFPLMVLLTFCFGFLFQTAVSHATGPDLNETASPYFNQGMLLEKELKQLEIKVAALIKKIEEAKESGTTPESKIEVYKLWKEIKEHHVPWGIVQMVLHKVFSDRTQRIVSGASAVLFTAAFILVAAYNNHSSMERDMVMGIEEDVNTSAGTWIVGVSSSALAVVNGYFALFPRKDPYLRILNELVGKSSFKARLENMSSEEAMIAELKAVFGELLCEGSAAVPEAGASGPNSGV